MIINSPPRVGAAAFRSAAVITAEPWTHRPTSVAGLEERAFDGRWHITQTDRLPGCPTEIFLLPHEVAGGRRPKVGAEGTLIETTGAGAGASVWRWEPHA